MKKSLLAVAAAAPIAAILLAPLASAKTAPPPRPVQHALAALGAAGNKAVVGIVGQTEAEVNGTLYNLGFRPYP